MFSQNKGNSDPAQEGKDTDLQKAVDYYIESLKSGKTLEKPPTLLAARLCRARPESIEEDFKKLSYDPERRSVFCMTSVGMHNMCGKKVLDQFLSIGYETDWLRSKIKGGCKFRLGIFPVDSAVSATWEGVWKVFAQMWPECWDKVKVHCKEIEKTSFSEINGIAGYDMR